MQANAEREKNWRFKIKHQFNTVFGFKLVFFRAKLFVFYSGRLWVVHSLGA